MSGDPLAGAKISGGPIHQFREGWAVVPFVGTFGKPHYWRRIDLSTSYVALCGLQGGPLATREELIAKGMVHASEGIMPFAPGDFMDERCKHCARRRRQTLG